MTLPARTPHQSQSVRRCHALLAGDGLLTAAFRYSRSLPHHKRSPQCNCFSEPAGPRGMSADRSRTRPKHPSAEMLEYIHRRETGALIQWRWKQRAVLCGATPEQQQSMANMAVISEWPFNWAVIYKITIRPTEKVNFVRRSANPKRGPSHQT